MVANLSRLGLLFVGLWLVASAPTQAHAATGREFSWEGYTWTVRQAGAGNPGLNRWGDTSRNVRVRSDGSLLLNIANGRAVEVEGPRLGHGRYRWVVRSRLDTIDPFRVFAVYTADPARPSPTGEQDLEFARWGDPSSQSGWFVSWGARKRRAYGNYHMTRDGPYALQLVWRIGRVDFLVKDARGVQLLRQSVPTVDSGQRIVPLMSYWLYPGHGGNRISQAMRSGAHPPIIIDSFRFAAHKP